MKKQFFIYLLLMHSFLNADVNCQWIFNDVPCQASHYDIQLIYDNIPVTDSFHEFQGLVNISCIVNFAIKNFEIHTIADAIIKDVNVTKKSKIVNQSFVHNRMMGKQKILNITLNSFANKSEEYQISFKLNITLVNQGEKYYQSVDIRNRNYTQRLDLTRFAYGTLMPYMTGTMFTKSTFRLSVTHPQSLKLITGIPIHRITESTKNNMFTTITENSIKMNIYSFGYGFSNYTERVKTPLLVLSPYTFNGLKPFMFLKFNLHCLQEIIYEIMFTNNLSKPSSSSISDLRKGYNNVLVVPDLKENSESYFGMIYLNENVFYNTLFNNIERQRVIALLSAYELAYQWFGHFIQPNHLQYIWLSKSISVYLQMQSVNELYSHWEIMNEFTYMYTHPALEYDAYPHTIYLEADLNMISHDFQNDVLIKKGAAIIRMLSSIAGEKQFNSGLSRLFNNVYNKTNGYSWETFVDSLLSRIYSNATYNQIELFCEIHPSTSNFYSGGYPVISVNKLLNKITFSQHRFFYDYQSNLLENIDEVEYNRHSYDNNYYVPITYTTSSELDFVEIAPKFILDRNETVTLQNIILNDFEWIIVNIQQIGYYRVNYFENNWIAITKFLMEKDNIKKIHVLNRAQLIDDSFNLARGGLLQYNIPFNLIVYLANEEDPIPWSVTIKCLNFLENFFIPEKDNCIFQLYYSNLISIAQHNFPYDKGFLTNVTYTNGHLIKNIYETACRLELPECVSFAMDIYKKNRIDTIPNSVMQIVLCTVIRQGTANDWHFIRGYYMENLLQPLPASNLLKILACTRDPWFIVNVLKMTIRKSNDGTQDRENFMDVIKVLLQHDVGRRTVYKYLRKYPELVSSLEIQFFVKLFETIIQSITNKFEYEAHVILLDSYSKYIPYGYLLSLKGQLFEIKKLHVLWGEIYCLKVRTSIKNILPGPLKDCTFT